MSKGKEVVIYFVNGRMVKIPVDKVRYAHMGGQIDEEYTPDISDGVAVVNWDNVCFVREWTRPEEDDD